MCAEVEDGIKVSDVIKNFLNNNKSLILSFLNIEMVTSSFLNTAIGVLYKDFSDEQIKLLLKVEDMQPFDIILLKRVIETAKEYYKNPKKVEQSVNEVLEEK